MVKLVRLTTENNNNFNADMDSDLILGEKSSVAIQNLTFETEFNTLNVTGADRTLTYNFNTDAYAGFDHNEQLKLQQYTSANYNDFFGDLAGALNDTCSIGSSTSGGIPGDTEPMNNYQQFNVTADDEKKKIQMRVTPMLHPLLKTRAFDYQYEASDGKSDYDRSNLIFTSQPAGYDNTNPTAGGPGVWINAPTAPPLYNPIDWGVVTREDGVRSTAIDRYIHPVPAGVEWSKGSAVWWCRVHLLTSNSGNKDAHGFAIGLSKTQITGQPIMPDSHRDYEVRVHDTSHNIFYIDPTTANTLTDGGVGTFKVTATNEEQNDIMMLRKDRNVIKGLYITGDGGGTVTELFSHTIPASERNAPLYPYAYWCGAGNEDQMGQPSITLDPFKIDEVSPDAYRAFMTPQIGDMYGYRSDGPIEAQFDSGYERSSAALQTKLPVLNQNIYEQVPLPNQVTTVTIAKDILRWLGFSGPLYEGSGRHTFKPTFNANQFLGTFGFEIIPEEVFQIANSDNYVVILDSMSLLSYDASQSKGLLLNDKEASKIGRRLNILATIPVNNNNGFVEFDANELVYIDLDNKFPQNIANLRLRVLDKTLNEVTTLGESVMTILFKDE